MPKTKEQVKRQSAKGKGQNRDMDDDGLAVLLRTDPFHEGDV
jgi:hypothetical protein